jgi:hypothetical protein
VELRGGGNGGHWRLELARRIAMPYAREPNARAVMIAGSVGRRTDDRWSDVEIDVYYERPPTEDERRAAALASGGKVVGLYEDEHEWEEQLSFGGFHAHTSTFLVSTLERCISDVVAESSTDAFAQSRLFSLLHAVPVKGASDAEAWRARAGRYPDGLRHAMLAEYLRFDRFRYMGHMLAERGDVLLLQDVLVEVGARLVAALLGLNRIYLPTPAYAMCRVKGADEMIGLMAIKPLELSARLRSAFRGDPVEGVAVLEALVDETFALVDTHAPGFDTAPYRSRPEEERVAWDDPPPLSG